MHPTGVPIEARSRKKGCDLRRNRKKCDIAWVRFPEVFSMSRLSAESVTERLKSLTGWKLENKEIVRQFEFPDFRAAMQFVNAVAEKAEAAGHHPDIDIRYNKVRLGLISHDAGGLTERDMDLAQTLNSLKGA
jgi:4a-hydroxytetrahydrobiopterin dehydratase